MKDKRRTSGVTLTEFLLARIAEDEMMVWGHENLAHWLADCAAKRQLADMHSADKDPFKNRNIDLGPICRECSDWSADPYEASLVEYPCETLKVLGSVYADHPDYLDEWRP
jgi:hypothetical protein